MKLSDEVIAHIAKILQMAIITGTDIIDHMRMMILDEVDGEIVLNEEYAEIVETNVQKMIDNVLEQQKEQSDIQEE